MAHAIRMHEAGGPDVLRWEEVAVGNPGPGQVRLRHVSAVETGLAALAYGSRLRGERTADGGAARGGIGQALLGKMLRPIFGDD